MRMFVATACLFTLGAVSAAQAPRSTLELTSPDLPAGQPIPDEFIADTFGCHGPNLSPALKWSHAPAGTRSFAITMFDPYEPPVSGWWHWVVYDIPATVSELPRGAGSARNPGLPAGARQVRPDGDAPEPHYYGPCPDEGDPPHPYTITVYALSVEHLDAAPTSTPANIDYLISSKVLAKSTLVRPFSRPRKSP
ncbi:MAG: YbhB/YbcL family Raf kinase inhibitor-like protein [Proteobacteria bacterium]|nr:YbhB/YbcL family Raf kinase inhibitor-like protein [Pseudomonadota bacterium]